MGVLWGRLLGRPHPISIFDQVSQHPYFLNHFVSHPFMSTHQELGKSQIRKLSGELIFSSWKGVEYFRSRPQQVANPRTPAQLRSRARMKVLSQIGASVKSLLIQHLQQVAQNMSGYNLFIGMNTKAVTGHSDGSATIDWQRLRFSKGSLQPCRNTSIRLNQNNRLRISWTAPISGDDDFDHLLAIFVLDEETKICIAQHASRPKQKGMVRLNLPADLSQAPKHVYLYGYDLKLGKMSPTQYLGSFTP